MTIDTRALRDARAKTTPGKWEYSGGCVCVMPGYKNESFPACAVNERDAAFIVLAHEQMPALLDEVEEAKRQKDWRTIAAMRGAGNMTKALKVEALEAEVESLRAEVARLTAVIQEDAEYTAHRPGAK